MQLFVYTFKDARTVESGSSNNWSEISLTSEFKDPPEHSTSCILEIPRKSRDVIPETKSPKCYDDAIYWTDLAVLPDFLPTSHIFLLLFYIFTLNISFTNLYIYTQLSFTHHKCLNIYYKYSLTIKTAALKCTQENTHAKNINSFSVVRSRLRRLQKRIMRRSIHIHGKFGTFKTTEVTMITKPIWARTAVRSKDTELHENRRYQWNSEQHVCTLSSHNGELPPRYASTASLPYKMSWM